MTRFTLSSLAGVAVCSAILFSTALPADACARFRRGDTNADGAVDLSDAVATLLYLFSGAAAPACKDAADTDDSGRLGLTDAVYTLDYLFLGAAAPPDPGPTECGFDESFDELECEAYPSCEPAPAPRNFSGFKTFQFQQDPGFGFCPDLEMLYKVRIEKQADGGYTAALTSLREGMFGVDDCLPPIRGSACYVPEEDPPRPLTAQEIAEMTKVFSSLGVHDEPDNICHCIAIDPCRIATYTWDEEQLSAFLCSAPRLGEEQAAAVSGFLESLRTVK